MTLIMLHNDKTVGVSLGVVTFSATMQNRSLVFPVKDDNIALEPDEVFTLCFRKLGRLQEASPSSMRVTVVDDDGKQ